MACSTSSFSFNFDQALAYTLSCLKQEGLTLKEEQIKAVELLSKGKDVFVWFPILGVGSPFCTRAPAVCV